ncbi:MAG: hypothetical protein IKJ56_06280 [Bacteroidales bacterium]|nr:hypothetical protein [Bacteroidales bacterium]
MRTFSHKPALVLAIIIFQASYAFAQTWLWPMAGHKTGENIISQPSSYIGKEYNCCDIFISGEAGDFVICPADGTIAVADILYRQKIGYIGSLYYDSQKSWDENIQHIGTPENVDPQYLSGNLSITIADGRRIHIDGLRGNYHFKSGQKVAAGDTLGQIGWSYKKINQPSLCISVTAKTGMADDPMTPFGLESKFHLDIIEREDPISVEKMREDLTILENAVLEIYPSLNGLMPEDEYHKVVEDLRQSVKDSISLRLPVPLIRFVHLIHDSHLTLLPDQQETKPHDFYVPVFFYIWCNDTLRVLVTGQGYEQYAGRVITSIDGVAARDYAKQAYQYIDLYDLNVQSHEEETSVFLSMFSVLLNQDATANTKSHIVLDDGEEVDIPFSLYPCRFIAKDAPINEIMKWRTINTIHGTDSVYTTRKLNDSTAYLSIRTFDINSTKLEQIVQWIGECQAANMIIDLRNNEGGDVEVTNRLLSCFAQQPMNRQRGSHLYVNKQGNFEYLRYGDNHQDDEIIFPKYKQLEGKPGYYCFDTIQTNCCVMPDSSHQYTGRVYVLTNGCSMSAATIFPAVLVRNRRGVSVGRETGSAYHYITALERANIILPNSLNTVAIPMVKVVFDTTVCERTPWGRGLLPDYELPLSYNEITMGADGETDVMLEYALQLIAEGKYLSEIDPFAEIDAQKSEESSGKCNCLWIWILVAIGIISVAGIFVGFRCRKNRQKA